MKKIYYNKLIRDGVAERMKRQGIAFETRKLDEARFEAALIAKVEEEAGGVVKARTREELLHEIHDILAVIDEIKKFKKVKLAEFNAVRKENMAKKGGFDRRLWLVWSEDNGYKTNEKRGKK